MIQIRHDRYEQYPFNTGGGGGSSDYLFMLIFGAACLHLVNLYMGAYVMGQVGRSSMTVCLCVSVCVWAPT